MVVEIPMHVALKMKDAYIRSNDEDRKVKRGTEGADAQYMIWFLTKIARDSKKENID